MKVLQIIILAMLLQRCMVTNEEALDTLNKAGFKQPVVTGSNWMTCGEGDKELGADFEAINTSGQKVNGTVCCGIFKGCTVRF